MEKNRFYQLLESTMGDVKPLLESDESDNFVVTNDTTLEEFTAYLEKQIESKYVFGDEATLGFIIEYLIKTGLVS